jgi:hypothetical protein
MNAQHEAIFQKAMVSQRPQAILEVARAFELLGKTGEARCLYQRTRVLQGLPPLAIPSIVAFGAMARGTPVKDTNGAVIPPGRYWLDALGDKRKTFTDWAKSKPEVKIETTEDHADENRLFVIFTIPSTASNYGLSGVFFPTNVLGFPTIASGVQSSQDTVQRPDAPTSTDVLANIGKTVGTTAKSMGEGLGLSPTRLILIGGGILVIVILANQLIPKILANKLPL